MIKKLRQFVNNSWAQSPSAFTLIIVNLFPVFGVFYWRWEVFPIMFLFWSENVIVGFYNILRMLCVRPKDGASWMGKLFMIPFFIVHYGMFTAAHGVFVIALFGEKYFDKTSNNPFDPNMMLTVIRTFHLHIALIAIFISHSHSFIANYIKRGEYLRISPGSLMMRPYTRIVIMQITLIAGGFLIMILKAPLAGLILFILLKTGVDLAAHLKEHRN